MKRVVSQALGGWTLNGEAAEGGDAENANRVFVQLIDRNYNGGWTKLLPNIIAIIGYKDATAE